MKRRFLFDVPTLGARSSFVPGLALALFVALTWGAGCRSVSPSLGPASRLESVEGYASLNLTGPSAAGKSKVSFSLRLPDRARIDVFDALGRPIITLICKEDESYFVAVSRKAYWRGGRGEVLEKFLGFEFSPEDMAELLAGRWGQETGSDPKAASSWTLTRDSRNRVVSAERQDVSFEVKDFFVGTSLPHTVVFAGGRSSGRLKIFEVKFNAAPRESVFRLGFLNDYAAMTWPEMEDLLNHEDEIVR